MIRNLWRRLRDQVVQEVPASVSVCEFDCGALACREGDWERCESRSQLSTAGLRQWKAQRECQDARLGERADEKEA